MASRRADASPEGSKSKAKVKRQKAKEGDRFWVLGAGEIQCASAQHPKPKTYHPKPSTQHPLLPSLGEHEAELDDAILGPVAVFVAVSVGEESDVAAVLGDDEQHFGVGGD